MTNHAAVELIEAIRGIAPASVPHADRRTRLAPILPACGTEYAGNVTLACRGWTAHPDEDERDGASAEDDGEVTCQDCLVRMDAALEGRTL